MAVFSKLVIIAVVSIAIVHSVLKLHRAHVYLYTKRATSKET